MSSGPFESPPVSFNSLFDPPPFYDNLHYREVLATLRYGIITHKGLVLLIGDFGMGKSRLLDQLTRELDACAVCISEPDPAVNFSGLLQLVLDNLQSTDIGPSRLSLLQRCKEGLRAQLEKGRTVSLMIDNAERLGSETLEQMLHHFWSADPIDGSENLLQIVLAGRPALRDNLAQARQRLRKPPTEITCQLQPLQDEDIAAYLKTRLRAANLPEEIFSRAAIEQIVAYTGGNPHWINAISNRTLQVSGGSSGTQATAEMVKYAARSLDLPDPHRPAHEPIKGDFEIPSQPDKYFRRVKDDATEVMSRTFLNSRLHRRNPWSWPTNRSRKVIQVLGMVLLLAGGAVWLQSQREKTELSNSVNTPSKIASAPQKLESYADALPPAKQEVPVASAPGAPPPPPTGESATGSHPFSDTKFPVLTEKAAERPPAMDPMPASKEAPALARDNQAPVARNADARRKFLEAQVYQAIENRAIIGITVSVIDDIIYLDGQVATEAQRNTAERAAQSVAGIDRVRNRIAIAEG